MDQPQYADRFCAQKCYEDFYCARGNMENQIKQQYLDLEADRTSTHWMASNQLRLWFSAFALLLFQRLRTIALRGTQLANATAGTIRQRFLKIGAVVTVSTRAGFTFGWRRHFLFKISLLKHIALWQPWRPKMGD
jgi:hypothetical protein